MSNLLASLLGFFITVTLLLILFRNCSFTAGCGGSHRSPMNFEMMEDLANVDVVEDEMEELGKEDPPEANDLLEGYASVDASGTGYTPKKEKASRLIANGDYYLEPPFATNFGHDPHGVPHGYQRDYQNTIDLMKDSYPHLPGVNLDIYQ